MKKILRLLISLLSLCSIVGCGSVPFSQLNASSRVEQVRFYSLALHKSMNMDVYLPPHYNRKVKYPVLYVLHGKDGNADSWMNGFFGFSAVKVGHTADKLISSGKLQPIIIVSPEIDNSYGLNTANHTTTIDGYSRGLYADYLIHDVISYVDHHYSTNPARDARFIGGFSMGGYAALYIAFTHPKMFSKVGAYSAALWDGYPPMVLRFLYSNKTTMSERDPIHVAANNRSKLHHLDVLIDCGKDDPFASADHAMYMVLKQSHIPVTYDTHPGGHTYSYWHKHAGEFLLFFAKRS